MFQEQAMTEKEIQIVREAIQSDKFSHARFRQWCGYGITYIYHRDPKSPSGVLLAASGSPSIVDPMLRELRKSSPLSPTEGIMKW